MAKIKISDLAAIKDRVHRDTSLREGGAQVKITVHMGTCGIASGARQVLNAVMDALGESERTDIIVTTSGCAGLCSHEPMMTLERLGEEPIKYAHLDETKARQIFQRHALGGEVQAEWALAKGSE